MRYAVIMAGGSGTRLWPMSRRVLPKQLIPFLDGQSLLRVAFDRLDGLVDPAQRYVCAGHPHREAVLATLPELDDRRFLGEPTGRDTLNAVGLTAAVLAARDPEAVFAVFTADHVIEPVERFREIVAAGFDLVDRHPNTLVTFGITPSYPATAYGYLQLGPAYEGATAGGATNDGAAPPAAAARVVELFREKPPREQAEQYLREGSNRYVWNSGMFVWRAATLLECIGRYEPAARAGLDAIAAAWDTPDRTTTLERVFPALPKISIDRAVMERAAGDPAIGVAAIAMPVQWLDVGSWPAFAATCPRDGENNALSAGRTLLLDTADCLVASNQPDHLVAVVGCQNLVVVHTADATLVCSMEMAERIKDVQQTAHDRFDGQHT